MPIIAKASKSYTPCPVGAHQAVCCDVVDLGNVKVSYNGKEKEQHKIQLVWQIDEENPEYGDRFTARRRYTLSLDEKASLRKDLESWRGRPFTSEELKGFDVEVLIGINCLINVNHEVKNGETYANVTSVMPLAKGMQKLAVMNYTRVKDRDPQQQAEHADENAPTDEEVPF